jgi:hypothetical protein
MHLEGKVLIIAGKDREVILLKLLPLAATITHLLATTAASLHVEIKNGVGLGLTTLEQDGHSFMN